MFDRKELKENAKAQLSGNWGRAVVCILVFVVITGAISGIGSIKLIGFAAVIILMPPILVGLKITFLNLVKFSDQPQISSLFLGFNNLANSLGTVLWMQLWTWLWSLLFIIPGIIKSLAYSQTLYILVDNPNVRPTEALKISMRMTNGYKADIFVMYLSFIGWAILAAFTFGIGYLWLTPYMETSFANLYLKLKNDSIQSGVCHASEFGV